MSAEIHKLPEPATRLHCAACGVTVEAACKCGVGYITAAEAAARAVAASPEKSNRAIAAETGVNERTVRRARNATAANAAVEKRIGRDGKKRRQPKHRNPGVTEETKAAMAAAVLDDGKTLEEAAAALGVASVQVVKMAVAEEQGRREARREFIEAAPAADRAAIERALRKEYDKAYQCKLDDALLAFSVEEWFPAVKNYLGEARKIVEKSREPMFTEEQYNAMLKCTHGTPSEKTRGFATRILTTYKHVLLGFDKAKLTRTDIPRMPVLHHTRSQLDALRRKVQRERSQRRRALPGS